MYFTGVINIEIQDAVVATVVAYASFREVPLIARKLPMQVVQVQMEISSKHVYLALSFMALFVPSFNSQVVFPVSIETYDPFSYQDLVVALLVEEEVVRYAAIIDLVDNHDLPLVHDVDCNQLVETKTYDMVFDVLSWVAIHKEMPMVEIREENIKEAEDP